MKPIIAIDTALFAIPNFAETEENVQGLLQRVNDWASAAENQNCFSFAAASDVVEVLDEANCFPATHNIQALLELYGLEHVFTAQEVNSRIFSLISRCRPLFETYGVEVTAYEDASTVDLDLSSISESPFEESFCRLMCTIARSGYSDMSRVVLGYPFDENKLFALVGL